MPIRLLRAALPAILACSSGLQLAHADIYTWTDESGVINISNLTPPEGTKLTKVTHESPPQKISPPGDSVVDKTGQADVLALAERVRQLEHEIELANRPAPPAVGYSPAPAAPVVQYIVNLSPPNPAPPTLPPPPTYGYGCDPTWGGCDAWAGSGFYPGSNGCNPGWLGCGSGWGPVFYPASVVVVSSSNFRPRSSPFHGGHRVGMQTPLHGPGAPMQLPAVPTGARRR